MYQASWAKAAETGGEKGDEILRGFGTALHGTQWPLGLLTAARRGAAIYTNGSPS
jgi:hypothetical protein